MIRDRMGAGDVLRKGEYLQSPDGRTRFTFQDDGNCCLTVNGKFAWGTMTQDFFTPGVSVGPVEFVLQGDGNICLYGPNQTLFWQSHTNRPASSIRLTCQDDNNLVLYLDNYYVWASGTAHLPKWSKQRLQELKTSLGLNPDTENAAAQQSAEQEFQRRMEEVDRLHKEVSTPYMEYRERKNEADFVEHPIDWYEEHGPTAIPPVFTTRNKWDAIRDRDAAARTLDDKEKACKTVMERFVPYRRHLEELKTELNKFPADE